MNSTNIIKFLKQAEPNGGGSYSFITGETNPTTGYMVSIRDRQRIIDELQVKEVQCYVTENKGLLMTDGAFLGVWVSDGKWYLDVSYNVHRLESAIKMGKANEQIAIWDCEHSKEVSISQRNIDEIEGEIFKALYSIATNPENKDKYGQVGISCFRESVLKKLIGEDGMELIYSGKSQWGTMSTYGGRLGTYKAMTLSNKFYRESR